MQKQRAEIDICGRSDGRLAAAMVHCSLFMVLCLNFMLFRVSRCSRARGARERAQVRFRAFSYE